MNGARTSTLTLPAQCILGHPRASHMWGAMEKSATEKVLVIESDEGLRANIVRLLSDAGYAVSEECREGIRPVLAFGPDVILIGANPRELDCCDLLSEIKGSEQSQ